MHGIVFVFVPGDTVWCNWCAALLLCDLLLFIDVVGVYRQWASRRAFFLWVKVECMRKPDHHCSILSLSECVCVCARACVRV